MTIKATKYRKPNYRACHRRARERSAGWAASKSSLFTPLLFEMTRDRAVLPWTFVRFAARGKKPLLLSHLLQVAESQPEFTPEKQQQQQPWKQFKDLQHETDNDSGLSSLHHIYLHTMLKSWHGAVPHYSLQLSFLASWWTLQRQEVQKVIFFPPQVFNKDNSILPPACTS